MRVMAGRSPVLSWTLWTCVLTCALAPLTEAGISRASRSAATKLPLKLREEFVPGKPIKLTAKGSEIITQFNNASQLSRNTQMEETTDAPAADSIIGHGKRWEKEAAEVHTEVSQRGSPPNTDNERPNNKQLFSKSGRNADGFSLVNEDKSGSLKLPGGCGHGREWSRDTALRRKKRSGAQRAEHPDGVQPQGSLFGERKISEALQDAYRPSPEFRRSGEDVAVTKSRQGEPHLVTSTFALSGDSAHNQAMVHWSGHNSSVILILTKLYDFNMGTVTESSLWRSVDYGTTYERLTDKVWSRMVLSYLYVCPTNKKKILILSDPEVESNILISSDEGANFQKFSINFYVLSLLFHPTQENWILAYSDDHKLYSSMDFGRNWNLVHELVTPSRFYWAVSGLDKEADLVHIEARAASGHAQYVTCRAQRCSESSRQHPFSGRIDISSLVVQDDYVFIQLTTSGRAKYFVSYQRGSFKRIQLPKYSLPKDMHIISTDEKQVFAAVQEWNQNDTYSLYISDTRGVYFTRSLPNLRISRGPEGNIIVDVYKVLGINGMFIVNKKEDDLLKTYITYNKGQTWSLLQAPATDLAGNDISCSLPLCSLHLHLQMSENPYTPGSISTKDSAPGIIVATGNIGPGLSYSNIGMYISSDAGNSWRQIFEEEHNVWFLDHGGALLAVIQASVPIRHLWISLDEGRHWERHSFSSTPLFVDGVLMEQETENHIITFFGHFSYRSDWQLIKIDYRSIFNRKCSDGDYQTWHLHNKGEVCVMGVKQIYKKRKAGNRCSLSQEQSRVKSAEPCLCRVYDFECDYGFERQANGKCSPAFWYNTNSSARGCSPGQTYVNSTGYRKVLANNCKEGLKEVFSPRTHQCRSRAPSGVQVSTSNGELSTKLGTNVTFLVHLQDGDSVRTNIRLDFGDGISLSYSNLSRLDDGIRHVYRAAGIFRVTAYVQNSLGSDSSSLFLHVTGSVEHVFLSAPIVAIRGKEMNLTAVVWPSQPRTATFYWWFENSTEPIITLEGSLSHSFLKEGMNTVTVQVSSGNTVLQDTKVITVKELFRSLLLSFSPNLEEHNPAVAEWRQDVGRVVKAMLSQVGGFPAERLLVSVFPGVPTAAELFILPDTNLSELRTSAEEELDQISAVLVSVLNQNLIQFELKPDTRITVYVTQLTLAPLVDSSPMPSGSAMLMLLSLAFVGLAVFFIYKFKRKIPWIHIHAEDSHEKEPEMISAVGQSEATSHTTLSQFPTAKELLEKELEARNGGGQRRVGERMSKREIPTCTNV